MAGIPGLTGNQPFKRYMQFPWRQAWAARRVQRPVFGKKKNSESRQRQGEYSGYAGIVCQMYAHEKRPVNDGPFFVTGCASMLSPVTQDN